MGNRPQMLYAVTPSQRPRVKSEAAAHEPEHRQRDEEQERQQPRELGAAALDEDRLLEGRRHAQLGRGLAAAVADQRLVGDLGPTVFADHEGGGSDNVLLKASGFGPRASGQDRKSTRLNSSHSQISYAVFCLKKKNKKQTNVDTA